MGMKQTVNKEQIGDVLQTEFGKSVNVIVEM
jgi:hypothetical protein